MSTTTIWELKNGEEKFLWDGEILPTFCQSEGWCMILRHFAKNRVFHSEGWCRFLPTFCRNTDSEEARCTLIYRAIALLFDTYSSRFYYQPLNTALAGSKMPWTSLCTRKSVLRTVFCRKRYLLASLVSRRLCLGGDDIEDVNLLQKWDAQQRG